MAIFGQKIHDFEFSKGYHYSHTLEYTVGEDFRKVSAETNDKN